MKICEAVIAITILLFSGSLNAGEKAIGSERAIELAKNCSAGGGDSCLKLRNGCYDAKNGLACLALAYAQTSHGVDSGVVTQTVDTACSYGQVGACDIAKERRTMELGLANLERERTRMNREADDLQSEMMQPERPRPKLNLCPLAALVDGQTGSNLSASMCK